MRQRAIPRVDERVIVRQALPSLAPAHGVSADGANLPFPETPARDPKPIRLVRKSIPIRAGWLVHGALGAMASTFPGVARSLGASTVIGTVRPTSLPTAEASGLPYDQVIAAMNSRMR